MMKRWVASPKTPMETIEVASEDLCILRDSPRLDPGEFTISRLPAFERELVKTVPQKGVEHVTQTILQLLEANRDPWWAPYLFESYAELIYRPVADRLFENSCRHWEFVKGLGKIFLYGVERTGCEEMGFPFIGYGTLEDGVPVKRKVALVQPFEASFSQRRIVARVGTHQSLAGQTSLLQSARSAPFSPA